MKPISPTWKAAFMGWGFAGWFQESPASVLFAVLVLLLFFGSKEPGADDET